VADKVVVGAAVVQAEAEVAEAVVVVARVVVARLVRSARRRTQQRQQQRLQQPLQRRLRNEIPISAIAGWIPLVWRARERLSYSVSLSWRTLLSMKRAVATTREARAAIS
jgi:hypothetical protein